MTTKDGGCAFPGASIAQHGMTLRDYFAGQALTGTIAAFSGADTSLPPHKSAAAIAYEYADAMLVEREREGQ